MLGDYKLKFVRNPVDEFDGIKKVDPIEGYIRKTKKTV